MMYQFMTLGDGTGVAHSEMHEDGSVNVYFEKPVYLGFKSIECSLPSYTWNNNEGFTDSELQDLDDYLHSVSHIILELSQEGGFEHASGF